MRTVGADQVCGAHGLLAVGPFERGRHALVVLLEADQPDVALDLGSEPREPFPQDPLGLVLRDADEPEGDVGQRRPGQAVDLLAVDVDDLAAELDRLVQHLAQDAHALEDLQGPGLDADGLGVLRRFEHLVDDATGDAPAS